MPIDLYQSAIWPGVRGVASCQYVCSHGISPGKAVMTTYPQNAAPQEYGTLAFSDSKRTVKIPGCKVDSITPQHSSQSGTTFVMEILDNRWMWVGKGGITGHYNAKDDRGKLVPWTIRSPRELADICLDALGVKNRTVNLPNGLRRAWGRELNRYLKLGENFPQSFTNPEVIWTRTPPAEALAQLADMYGCRVIYQPIANRVLVTPPGKGKKLPNFPYESIGATIDGPEAPEFVGVFGAPVKVQMRFRLEAVGEEWDGAYLPINQLSYSPLMPPEKMVVRVEQVGQELGTGQALSVDIRLHPAAGGITDLNFRDDGTGLLADRFAALVAKINADPTASAFLTAAVETVNGVVGITMTAKVEGKFEVFLLVVSPFAGARWTPPEFAVTRLVNPGGDRKKSWDWTNVPQFSNVQPTDRLSYIEARGLAQKSVYRCYRILNRDAEDGIPRFKPGKPINVPFFGKIVKRRQQIVLLESKVEHVEPKARIPGGQNKANGLPVELVNQGPNAGILPEFYNGYSRAQANTVTGSVAVEIGNVNWLFANPPVADRGRDADGEARLATGIPFNEPEGERLKREREEGKPGEFNTGKNDRVFVEFTVNQVEQMIVFAEPVYRWFGGLGMIQEPDLILECGCHVLDPVTSQPYRWEEVLSIPGGTAPTEWTYREDVDVSVIGEYSRTNTMFGHKFFDLKDGRSRANYYMRGQAAKYKIVGGETRQYAVIVPVDPDGLIQQVTWSVGEGGPTTIASANTEHHPAIPAYPARRRAENLKPDAAAALANMKERDLLKDFMPRPPT